MSFVEPEKFAVEDFAEQHLTEHHSVTKDISLLINQWIRLVNHAATKCTASFVKRVLRKLLVWLAILITMGVALHEARNLYFKNAPSLIHHSHTWVVVLNAVKLDLYFLIIQVRLIKLALTAAMKFISHGRFPSESMPDLIELAEPHLVNASNFRHFLKSTTVGCGDQRTGWNALSTWSRAQTSPYICPLARATAPLGNVGKAAQYVFSPFSFDPNPQGNNCSPDGYTTSLASACLVVNSGLVILEVVIPFVVILFILQDYFMVALQAVWLSLKTIILAVRAGVALFAVQISYSIDARVK